MFRNKDYVLAVLKAGSFSKAAEEMYISQPSLSASIKRIESKISSPIFNRTTPVTLTQTGREYVRRALAIREIEDDFSQFIFDQSNLLVGEIKIGGSSLFSSFILPGMIAKFSKTGGFQVAFGDLAPFKPFPYGIVDLAVFVQHIRISVNAHHGERFGECCGLGSSEIQKCLIRIKKDYAVARQNSTA